MLSKLLAKVDGWKTVIGALMLQVPVLANDPLLVKSVKEFALAPSVATGYFLAGNLIILGGALHRTIKNLNKAK